MRHVLLVKPAWLVRGLLGLGLLLASCLANAQDDPPGRVGRLAAVQGEVWVFEPEPGEWVAALANRPYTAGAVVNVGSLRTEPGQFEAYKAYLAGPYKKMMEEQKAAGIILDYKVYVTTPRSPDDPDIYLLTVYKNMTALDGLNERTDPIQQKMFGDLAQRGAATVERQACRPGGVAAHPG